MVAAHRQRGGKSETGEPDLGAVPVHQRETETLGFAGAATYSAQERQVESMQCSPAQMPRPAARRSRNTADRGERAPQRPGALRGACRSAATAAP